MKTKILIITVFIACIAADCNKDKNRPTYYMPQDFKDYVSFPEGSYWIYEDSISGEIDSLFLQSQTIEIIEPPSYNDWEYNYEKLSQGFNGLHSGYLYAESFRHLEDYYEYFGYGYFFDIAIGTTNTASKNYYSKIDSLKIRDDWYKI